ncbi:MAG TPA: M1 family aminopeptidase [Candidatus Limnocylindrales bacterium]|nr:M1 family aminopeptidase [Candidatus Limnocylindrales bacterium]
MHIARQPLRRACLAFGFVFLAALPALAQKPRIQVQDYQIDAEIVPKTHHLTARARVKFTALEDINFASFELHNALHPTKVLDENGKPLSAERVTQDNAVRITFPTAIPKGTTTSLTFEYEGALANADDSPVEGLKLAYIGEDVTYLLYPGRWFPVSNYGIDRFTATINITAPAGTVIIGSGSTKPEKPAPAGKVVASFSWQKPSFPGTLVAGPFVENTYGGGNMKVYFTDKKKQFAPIYGDTAIKEMEFFTSIYGPAPSPVLKLVELPDDTVPTWWAPEISAIAARDISDKTNYRLLADSVAHQWWGGMVSPAAKEDWWIMDGGARASEMRYVQSAAGATAFEDATRDMAVGALAYDTTPLASVGRLDTFSPQFQALVTDKGGMIFHMLRWVIGDQAFDNTMKQFMTQYAFKPVTMADLQAVAEKNTEEKLTPFFTQWVDGTGAPAFKMKYTVYRIKKGFRVVGEVSQDLDLFHMPVELKVDTDGQTEMKRIDVVGTESPFSIETFGKPRRLVLDPNNWVLKNSPDLKVRVAIRRGQELTAQGSLTEALTEFNKALDVNRNSSLAHYRIAEVFYLQRNYQSAANEYRESLYGDQEPRWTEVWSHIMLGKIFDITGQRSRAVNEYRQAIQTGDNTQGALDEARKYLEQPYQRERQNGI